MLIRKFISTGMIAPRDITAGSKSGNSARALAEKTGITAAPSNTAVAQEADVLFLCVKPADVKRVLDEVWGYLQPGVLVVSIAGSITLAELARSAGLHARVARVIPAVTSEQEAGVSLVAFGRGATPEDRALVLSLFNAIGTAVETEEENLDLYADLTSCAPAFIAAMMREYAAAAVRTGAVEPAVAEFLVRKTLAGTARLLEENGTGFDEVIRRVATKGGITEEGVKVLDARLPAVFDEVLRATERKRLIRAQQLVRGA
ncbi:MAG: pyrroline-5-carboxylate reductase [Methanoregula sp. PtaU1.Bin006]|nr:MAG: pyrroline-5-carboxylate reductase [Methanoregula sp. PtaB.Bin085]OPY35623.1 MAG: pyrroline-5-carboxylate reductase [Methanoregula sp. PtaU1.Bin006]